MWISMRQAAEHLAELGINRESARRALQAGLAGLVVRTTVFVGRLGQRRPTPEEEWRRWRGADLTAPDEEQRAAAVGWWRLAIATRVWLRARALQEMLPFVGVVAGLAVVGGEIASLHGDQTGVDPLWTRFELRSAGDWFEQLRGRRLGGPTGSPWFGWPDGIWQPAIRRGEPPLDRIGR